ncbi:MAG: hypothetical protein R3C62_02045 [Chloroflexota bacterium]
MMLLVVFDDRMGEGETAVSPHHLTLPNCDQRPFLIKTDARMTRIGADFRGFFGRFPPRDLSCPC